MSRLALLGLALAGCGQAAAPAGNGAAPSKTVVTASSAASTPAAVSGTQTPGPATVRLASFYSLGAAPLFVGVDKGLFAKRGADVQLERINSASDVMAILGSGNLDVVTGGLSPPFYNAVARGVGVKLAAPLGMIPTGLPVSPFVLVVRKDLYDSGELHEVRQLKGHKIAIMGSSTTAHWGLAQSLEAAGETLSDVNIIALGFPEMLTALSTKAIDGAVLASPFDKQATDKGWGVVLIPYEQPAGTTVTDLFVGPSLLQAKPEAGRRFMRGYLDAVRAIQGQAAMSAENLAIYAKYTGSSLDDLKASIPFAYDPGLRIDTKSLLDYQQFLLGTKALTYSTPLTEQQLVDRSLVDNALQQPE